jgi:hypothetical protein
MLVRPIADRFHGQGVQLGLWGGGVPEGLSHVPPAHEMIDPLKDTTALIAQVRAGLRMRSPSEFIALLPGNQAPCQV